MPTLTHYPEKLAHQGMVWVNHSNISLILTIFRGIVSRGLDCELGNCPNYGCPMSGSPMSTCHS
jgi:hypothetical protein